MSIATTYHPISIGPDTSISIILSILPKFALVIRCSSLEPSPKQLSWLYYSYYAARLLPLLLFFLDMLLLLMLCCCHCIAQHNIATKKDDEVKREGASMFFRFACLVGYPMLSREERRKECFETELREKH